MKTMQKLWCAFLISASVAGVSVAADALEKDLLWSDGKKPEQIFVGDQLRFKVEGVTLDDEQLKEIQVTGISSDDGWYIHPDSLRIDKVSQQMSFLISPLKSGYQTIPSFEFKIAEDQVLFKTVPLSLSIHSLLKGEKAPPTLLPPVKLPFPMDDLILGIALVLIIFIALIYLIYKKLKKPVVLPKVVVPELPIDVQVKKLFNKLSSFNHLEKGEFKEHYFGVSEILKWFLSKRFLVDAQEATTEEMLALLKAKKTSDKKLNQIKEFFAELDIVKFTDIKPNTETALTIIERALSLVDALMNKKVGDIGEI